MTDPQPKDPLHGVTLEAIVTALVDDLGWEELGRRVKIRCFNQDPSVASSLRFLRRTPWARAEVESQYRWLLRERKRRGRTAVTRRFRTATAADVATIVSLVESAYRGDASRAGWTTEADLLDGQRTDAREVGALLADPHARVVLADQGGDVVGSIAVTGHGDVAHLGMFAIRPTLQASGIGRALLAEAERVARDDFGATVGEMTVIVQREALIAWYERRGWARTGELQPFPYGDARFGLPKRDDLVFEVLRKALVAES